jgi:hypothetical protein
MDKKEKQKLYYEMNKEKIKEREKRYREENKEKILQKKKEYREQNKDKLKQYREENKERLKEYRQTNKEKLLQKEKEYKNKRKKNDPLYKLKYVTRTAICNSFKKNTFKKLTKTELILGCTFEEFKLHLESKFESWMTWDNYGLYNGELNYGWDIDHVIPMVKATNKGEVIELNHFTNLQPLCSKVNRDIKRGN